MGFIHPNQTINMLKPETSKVSLENEAATKLNAEKEKFVFSTFVSLVYATLRICETIMLIHEKGGKNGGDGDILKLCKNAMKVNFVFFNCYKIWSYFFLLFIYLFFKSRKA